MLLRRNGRPEPGPTAQVRTAQGCSVGALGGTDVGTCGGRTMVVPGNPGVVAGGGSGGGGRGTVVASPGSGMVVPGVFVASRLGLGPGTVVGRDDATPGGAPVLFGSVETLTSLVFAQPDAAIRVTITTTLSHSRPDRPTPDRWLLPGR